MVGVTTRTIQLKIKAGKISANRDPKGNYSIESSEFFRVYPKAKLSEKKSKMFGETNESSDKDLRHKIALLEQELKSLKSINLMLETQLEQASKREQDLIDISKSSARLLEDKSTVKRKKIFGLI